MTQTTAAATKAKTAKHVAFSFGLPEYGIPNVEMPKFDLSNTEMPEAFREMTEKGLAHVRDTYAKAKVASGEAADLLQNTYATVIKGANNYNLKLFEIARTNTGAAFDHAHELLDVKSPSEFIELTTEQMRKQFDMFSAQNKELCALAQEVATEAAEPIKIGVSKAFNKAP
jgi:phasin